MYITFNKGKVSYCEMLENWLGFHINDIKPDYFNDMNNYKNIYENVQVGHG